MNRITYRQLEAKLQKVAALCGLPDNPLQPRALHLDHYTGGYRIIDTEGNAFYPDWPRRVPARDLAAYLDGALYVLTNFVCTPAKTT